MSLNSALAAAARRVRSLNERLPDQHQIDVAQEWSVLLDAVDGLSDWSAQRVIADWVASMEMRLSGTLVHAPLDLDDTA